MNKPLKISFFASGIILFFGFYFFYPFGLPNVKKYFEPIGQRTLQKDEIGQFNYVYNTYEIMDITGGVGCFRTVTLEIWYCIFILCNAIHCYD